MEVKPKVGQTVKLNSTAREWFRGKKAIVEDVRSWGIIIKVVEDGCHYYYRAIWSELAK